MECKIKYSLTPNVTSKELLSIYRNLSNTERACFLAQVLRRGDFSISGLFLKEIASRTEKQAKERIPFDMSFEKGVEIYLNKNKTKAYILAYSGKLKHIKRMKFEADNNVIYDEMAKPIFKLFQN